MPRRGKGNQIGPGFTSCCGERNQTCSRRDSNPGVENQTAIVPEYEPRRGKAGPVRLILHVIILQNSLKINNYY